MDPLTGSQNWRRIANEPEDKVREYILTNWQEKGWQQSTIHTMQRLNDWGVMEGTKTVLDYGCGLLRNSDAFIESWQPGIFVAAFDTPEMIDRCMPLVKHPQHITLYDDFEELAEDAPYDLIFVSLVAQHMHPDALHAAFSRFPNMTSTLYVTGRDWSDHVSRDENPMATWDLIDLALDGRMRVVCEADDGGDHRTKLWTA